MKIILSYFEDRMGSQLLIMSNTRDNPKIGKCIENSSSQYSSAVVYTYVQVRKI